MNQDALNTKRKDDLMLKMLRDSKTYTNVEYRISRSTSYVRD